MTNYDAIKILQYIKRQVKEDREEDLALQHAIDVLDAVDALIISLKTLRDRSDGE